MDQFPLIYRLATGLYRNIVFPLRGGIRSVGTEKVPKEGGMILASVHMSNLDPPALAATLHSRRLRALAKEELWKNKLFGAIIQGIGAFPVRRGEGDTESLRKCLAILENGEAVIVFPEGHRNDGSTMNPLQAGAAMLAKRSGVPVVPAGISGTQKGGKGTVTVIYGEPIYYAHFAAKTPKDRDARTLFLSELATQIQSLCRQAGHELKSARSETDPPELKGRVEEGATLPS